MGIDACCVRESVCEISAAVPLDASFSAASDGAPALGSGNAEESPSASRSSFWNSRTDSSADSTAKETLLDASDCLRFFRAASLRLASAPSTLLTSLKMLLLRRLRMEEGVARDSTFSLASEATGVVAGLEGVAAAGEGIMFSACASAGGGAPLCRGERRRGGSEPAMAVRCVRRTNRDRDGTVRLLGPASMSRPEICARRSPGFARVHAESRAPARLTLATPLRTAASRES